MPSLAILLRSRLILVASRGARFGWATCERRPTICFKARRPQIRFRSRPVGSGGSRGSTRCTAGIGGFGGQSSANRLCRAQDRARRNQIRGIRRGSELRVRVASRRELRGKAHHPRVRGRLARRRAAHRQQLPIRQARLARGPFGLHPRARRWRGRRPGSPAAAQRGRGGNSAPIFFSIDDDIDRNTWNSPAVDWFRGINSVLGVERTGIYGNAQACGWAIDDGVIGHSTTPGHRWAWQTKAWSHGDREPAAVLYQGVVNTPSDPGPLLGGINVDVDDVLAADYGQWDLDR